VDEKVTNGSVVNGLDGSVTAPDQVRWTFTQAAGQTDTLHYVLGLSTFGEQAVKTNAIISYLVRGMYVTHAPFNDIALTIVTEKDLPALLDMAVAQFNALHLTDDKGKDEVSDAVKEIQKQRSAPPTTQEEYKKALKEVLEIIRDLDSVSAAAQSLSDLRDTLDKIVLIYERRLTNGY